MKKNKYYESLYKDEEMRMARKYDDYLMEQEEIKNANYLIIEKKVISYVLEIT